MSDSPEWVQAGIVSGEYRTIVLRGGPHDGRSVRVPVNIKVTIPNLDDPPALGEIYDARTGEYLGVDALDINRSENP